MSEKFRAVIICIILAIFAFPSITILAILKNSAKPSQFLYIEQWFSMFLFNSGFILLSLMSIWGYVEWKMHCSRELVRLYDLEADRQKMISGKLPELEL